MSASATSAGTIRVAREKLLEALQRVVVVASRAKLPVCAGVHCEVADGRMTLTATDLDQTISTSVPVECDDALLFVVPAKSLQTIVAQLPSAPVTIFVEARGAASFVEIKAGRARFDLAGFDPDQFPSRNESPNVAALQLPAPWLLAAIERAASFTTDEGSVWKQGVCISIDAKYLSVGGTDGHAMHRERIALKSSVRGEWIVPTPTVATVARIFANAETLTVVPDTRSIAFSDSTSTIVSRVLEGPYVDLNKIYAPAAHDEELSITVDRAALSATVKRVASLPGKFVAVRFTIDGSELTVNARDDGGSTSCDALPVAVEHKVPRTVGFAIGFGPTLLQRCLSAVTSEQVRLVFSTPEKPVLVVDHKPADAFDGAMIAPVRLQATEPPAKSRTRKGEF